MIKIAVFASGNGSNFENIALYFKDSKEIKIELILCNNKDAYVFERAKKLNITEYLFNKNALKSIYMTHLFYAYDIDYIVLAGFLWLIPPNIIEKYRNKIINIHPALLPKYGGKGMYGHHVHEAVIANKETESGITIHYVTEKYDEGDIIFQAKCNITAEDTAETLAEKVHELEYQYFPKIIETEILKNLK